MIQNNTSIAQNKYKISVIIPVYNVSKYLAQCLESVIYQTYQNLEIIIIDDGSTDNSSDIYNKYATQDNRIKIIKQTNAGLSAARNAGLNIASGKYVHFLDSDDYLDLDYYEKMLEQIVCTNADMACGGLYSDFITPLNIDKKVILLSIEDKLMLNQTGSGICKYLYRRDFIQRYNLQFEVGRFNEDVFWGTKAVYYANKIVTVPHINYYYRYNQNSIMRAKDKASVEKRHRDSEYATRQIFDFAREYGFGDTLEMVDKIADKTCSKIEYKLFSCFVLLKKKIYTNKTKYYLFGLLPVFTVE